MKKSFALLMVGVLLFSCKTTFNNQPVVDSEVNYDLLYHNQTPYTGNRSTYLNYFKKKLLQQPSDTTEMHLVKLSVKRIRVPFGKKSFRKKETIGVYVNTEGVWKLDSEYYSDSLKVTAKAMAIMPTRF